MRASGIPASCHGRWPGARSTSVAALPAIVLVRHAQASFGSEDYDELSEHGLAQVAAVDAELHRRGIRPSVVVAGSLRRQRDTAAPIAARAGVEVRIDPRWNEFELGDIIGHHSTSTARVEGGGATGISSEDFQKVLDLALEQWIAAGAGSTSDETWPALRARVLRGLGDLATSLGSGETAVVCTSAGVLGTVTAAVLELPDLAAVTFNRVAINTGITKLVHGRRGTSLITFNEHAHLEGDPDLVTYR